MKITSISTQLKNPNRVNVSVDGKFRFSLDIYQVVELGIKIGKEYSDEELAEIENESQFGKLYARALEYSLMRPRSLKEIRDYLWRKTRTTKYKSRTGQIKEREGVSQEMIERIFNRLVERDYVSDEKFAKWWVEYRNLQKGTSLRKLSAELRAKGVNSKIIESVLEESSRTDKGELEKIIAKKQKRYDDPQKFMQYLARKGFSYDDIKAALEKNTD